MNVWSDEANVCVAPEPAYERLLAEATAMTPPRALLRPAVILLVISMLVPIMAVQRVTIGLAITAALSWSFVVAIQWLVGSLVVLSAPARRAGFWRALDLWFAGHLPYSLWMLLFFSAMANTRSASVGLVILTAVVPTAWTAVIVAAFCRTVLGTSAPAARSRAAVHLVGIWIIGAAYVIWAAGGTAGPVRAVRHGMDLF